MAVYRAGTGGGGSDVEILYKRVGRGTALLAEALPGQRVTIVGPLGKAFPPAAIWRARDHRRGRDRDRFGLRTGRLDWPIRIPSRFCSVRGRRAT